MSQERRNTGRRRHDADSIDPMDPVSASINRQPFFQSTFVLKTKHFAAGTNVVVLDASRPGQSWMYRAFWLDLQGLASIVPDAAHPLQGRVGMYRKFDRDEFLAGS